MLKAGVESAATRRISSLIYGSPSLSTPAALLPTTTAAFDLSQAAHRLLDLLELEVLSQQLIGDLSAHFSSGHCLLFVHNAERRELELITPKEWYKGQRSFPLGKGLAGSVASSRSVLAAGPEVVEVECDV